MPTFDSALGIHQHAATLRAKRAGVLAANLANADTPHYKARDMDFSSVLGEFSGPGSAKFGAAGLRQTHGGHLALGSKSLGGVDLMYRTPMQASMDQNTVEVSEERSRFLDNALRYQASLRFLDGRFSSLRKALKGE